ncbi:MAG: tetratricopeptide repeat-containing sensor histidine kinase [Melioribacteraceae bacterium]|nr:tetratricopeptide repeat-containing sensor histidine kinase [Melioribacteraceae bacterium]
MKLFRSLIYFSFVFLTSLISAQNSADSLISSISNFEDSLQIKMLKEACWENRSKDPEKAILYGVTAINKMKETSIDKYYAEAYNYLGVIFGNLGKLDSAYYHYKIAIQKATEKGDSIQIGYSLNNIGDYYYKNALFSTALEYIFRSYEVFEKIGDEDGMAYTLNDIGEIYLKQEDYHKALEKFLKSGEIRYRIKDYRGYAKSLLNQAATYEKQGKDIIALNTYAIAREFNEQTNYVKGKSWALAGISDIYFKQMRLDKALEMRNEALEIDIEIGNKYGEIINYNQIGALYLKKGQYKEAEKYLNKALSEGELTGHMDQMLISYDLLKQVAMRSNNYATAYTYLENYTSIKDRVFSQESSNKIADLQMAFVTERKDREWDILKKDIEIEQNLNRFLIIISVLILGFVLLYISKFRSERKSNKKLNKANQQLNELNAQKDKLLSIIGHDLKNSACVIQNYLELLVADFELLNEKERTEYLKTAFNSSQLLTNLLLDILEWGSVTRGLFNVNLVDVKLHDSISTIIETLNPLAVNKKISLISNIGDSIIKTDKDMVNTVVRNLVSNAIKFTKHGGKIYLDYSEDQLYHYISTKDNGIGIDPEKIEDLFRIDKVTTTIGTANETGTGLGLPMAYEFVKKCNGEILVNSKIGEGSEFIVKLPKNYN